MGRRKLPLELIADEKSRKSTFLRRKEGLKKKLHEFTTLCDIDACMIIYGPYLDGQSTKLDIWAPCPTEVERIINKYYKSKEGVEMKEERAYNLAHFFEDRKRKINDDIEKLRRGNINTGWDHRMCHASYDQLKEILHLIDTRVDLAKSFFTTKEKNQVLMKGGTTTQKLMTDCTTDHVEEPSPQRSYTEESNAPAGSHHMNMQLVAINNNHLQEPKPLNSYMPQNYMLDDQGGGLQTYCPTFDVNSRTPSFTMMMLMDEDEEYEDYHDGSSSSTNNLQCTSLTNPTIYYDPRLSYGLLENVTYNNHHRLSSVCNNSPSNIQQPTVQQQFDPRLSSGLLENVRYNNNNNNNNYRRMSSVVGHYSPPNIQQQPVQQQFDPRSLLLENVAFNNNYRSRTSSVGHYSPPNIQQQPVQHQFDPSSLLLENVAYNNYHRTSSEGHYSPPNIQQPVQQHFVQRPMIISNATNVMMPSDHSPVNDYQLNENYYDFTNFQMKNKRRRY